MSNELQTQQDFTPAKYEGAFSNATNFEAAQRMAQALCSSSMVPKHYQGTGNIGNTIIALEMSQRMNASPLLIMQNLYLVHGNPGWSAKFLIATFNQSGRFTAIQYEWKGTAGQKDRGCRAYAEELRTGNRVEGPWIDWPLIDGEGWARKNGSKWLTMAEKMFAYRAAAWLVDTVAPEISMGLPPADQLEDIIDINPRTGEVIDSYSKKTTLADLKENSPRQTETHDDTQEASKADATIIKCDSTGEEFDPAHHMGPDVFNKDGSYRKKRITKQKVQRSTAPKQEEVQQQAPVQEQAPDQVNARVETGGTAVAPDGPLTQAQIMDLVHTATTKEELEDAWKRSKELPMPQRAEVYDEIESMNLG